MSRESIAKKELDKAEYRYKMSDKYNETLEKALTKGVPITGSLKSLDEYYKLPKEVRERFDYKYFQKKYGDRIKVPHDVGNKFGTAVEAALDISKGKNLNTTLIGLIASETAGKALKIGLIMFKLSPQGFLTSLVIDIGIGIAGDKISEVVKNAYDRLMNNNNDLPEITPNGFLKVTMPDGTVYARPLSKELRLAHEIIGEPQGPISGGNKNDVLFGGSGNDTLQGGYGNDILIGGSGYDIYYANNGDIIKDSDGKGSVYFSGIKLTGGKYDKNKKVYVSSSNLTEYKITNQGLQVTQGNETIIIEGYNKNNNDLGIVLIEENEISITISDNEKSEGDTPNQSMHFSINVDGNMPSGEFVIININGKNYMIGTPSKENIKKYNLDKIEYQIGPIYTYTWDGNEEKEEDKKFEVSGNLVMNSDKIKVKGITSGNGTIIDDDKDDKQDPEDVDPIIIDLNKNRITSTKLNNTIYFDHDNNNFKEATSWIDKGDAFLALDKNSNGLIDNGNELFGNHTISNTRFKYTNNKATNGYEALKAYDLNDDNVIDSKDEIYDKLLLWKDSNQNAITDKGELIKLKDSGIVSIDLNYKNTYTGEKGNTIKQSSTITFEDGSTTIANDVWFKVNLDKTKQTSIDEMIKDTLINLNKRQDELIKENNNLNTNDLNDDESLQNILNSDEILKTYNDKLNTLFYIKSLPQVKAFGNLSSLQETMVNNPKLATMMNLYLLMDEKTKKENISDIIYEWAGVSSVDDSSMRGQVKEKDMIVYEKLSGKPFMWKGRYPDANSYLKPVIEEIVNKFIGYAYANIELNTTYKDLNLDLDTMHFKDNKLGYDFASLNEEILSLYNDKKYDKITSLVSLVQDATIYKPIYNKQLKQNIKNLSKDDKYLLALCLNTFIKGTNNNDNLIGNDEDNIIEGFKGDDFLQGRDGDDIYKFDKNFGKDTIFDIKGDNKIVFSNITPDDIFFKRDLANLIIYTKDMKNQITINGFFCLENEYGEGALSIEFDNGEIWDKKLIDLKTPMDGNDEINRFYLTNKDDEIYLKDGNDEVHAKKGDDVVYGGGGDDIIKGGYGKDKIFGENGNDTLYGDYDDDYIDGGSGNDNIYGGDGDDTLIGGLGDDTLQGGEGNDTYIFKKREFGNDTILNFKPNKDEKDTIEFTDLKQSDLELTREFKDNHITNNLIIKVKPTLSQKLNNIPTSSIKILNFFNDDNTVNDSYKIDLIKTKDNKSLTPNDILNIISKTTSSDDIIKLSSNDKEISSGLGNDIIEASINGSTINTGLGDDTLISGKGDDILKGGAGSDTYIYNKGKDIIIDDLGDNDKLILLNKDSNNTQFLKQNNDLILKFDENNQVVVKNHFLNIFGKHNQIEIFEFSNATLKADEIKFTDITNKPNINIEIGIGDININIDNNGIDLNLISDKTNQNNSFKSFDLSNNTINKVIQDLNSYNDDNGINLNFNSEFKNSDIMQIYNS
jgi:Ca2+-binding RTX toxin-like protein